MKSHCYREILDKYVYRSYHQSMNYGEFVSDYVQRSVKIHTYHSIVIITDKFPIVHTLVVTYIRFAGR